MKILKLRFKNIHSLKGEHLIDFTVEPLISSGLFAITGPTGAGKSTILDVITLALFNKIPRFAAKGTESISKNDIEKIGSVMTHFTDDAYAEIEYESHQKQYRSTWSISRARTGNLRDYDMTLATLPDAQMLDLKKSEVPSENERILGLKYEQFIKSILLSQGDFARLLKSDDKERAKLLEDLTDSQIYRDIGRAVYEKAKEKDGELNELRQQADMLNIMSDEDVNIKTQNITSNQLKTKGLTDEVKVFETRLTKLEQKIQLNKQLNETNLLFKNLENKKKSFEGFQQKLTKHQKLDPHRSDISIWQNDRVRLNGYIQKKHLLENQKNIAAENLNDAIQKMADLTKNNITIGNFLVEMKKFENLIVGLDQKMSNLTELGTQARKKLHVVMDKYSKSWLNEIKDLKSIESQYENVVIFLNGQATLPIGYKGNDEALEQKMQQLNIEIHTLIKKSKDIKQYEDLKEENEHLIKQVSSNTDLIEINQKELTLKTTNLKAYTTDLENIKKAKDHLLKVVNLESYRDQLEPEKPCPLCGSIHHPYLENHHIIIDQGLDKAFTECEKLVNNSIINIQELKTKIAVLKSSNEENQKRIISNTSKSEEFKKEWGNNIGSYNEIVTMTQEKENLMSKLRNEAIKRADTSIALNIKEILTELNSISKNYQQLRTERSQWYTGTDISNDINHMQNLFTASREHLQAIDVTLKNLDKEIKEITTKISQLTEKLEKHITVLGYSIIDGTLSDILDDQTYKNLSKEKEDLIKEETSHATTLENIKKELLLLDDKNENDWDIAELKTKILDLQTEKDLLNLATGAIQNEILHHNTQIKLKTDLLKTIIRKEKEANPLYKLNHMIGDATGNKYAKFAQNLSLKQLISLANLRLEKLTDRYKLLLTDIEDDMRIIDVYQGNTTRSVKTLSGGETFIVSLALALSLADMASKNVKLNSLFIDEGFGTLDNDTLETSLVTLEKLQSESDRTIGIISHVESLKERITTQIRLQKNNQGYSTIEIV